MATHLLPPRAARTLYNAADALRPPAPGAVGRDWAPEVEAALRRRGGAEARRVRLLLLRLEWAPRLAGGRRGFSWLSREERAAALAARPAARDRLLALLAAAEGAAQSASGA